MEGEWPLVGRTAELERVAALIQGGAGGVVLVGPAGVGKTRLATECLAVAAGKGFVPLRAGATAAGSALPFGAFASLLPDVVAGVDRLEMLRKVERAVTERGGGKRVALFVDDAHLLDEASAALTHQLAVNGRTLVLATVRTGEPTLDAVVALWKDGLAERVEVTPLSQADVDALLRSVLGGPTDGATARRFWEQTEGNALFLRELILGALEAGVLREDRGIWVLSGKLPSSQRLIEVVEVRLAGLGAVERAAMEFLALGEPIGVELLTRSAGPVDLDVLERRGLVRIEAHNRRLDARLGHPLYGETLRSRLPPLRTRTLSRALADAVHGAGAQRREDILRLATWGLQGATIPPAVTLAGAHEARALYEFGLSERLARASIEAGATLEAQLLLAELLFLQGGYDDTERLLSSLTSDLEAGDEDQRARVALMRIDSLAVGGRAEDAMIALLQAEADLDDSRWCDEIGVRRAMFALVGGFTAVAAELVEPLLERVGGEGLVTACVIAGLAFGLQGRVREGLAAIERGLATHESLGRAHMIWDPAMTLMINARILLWAGHLAEAETVTRRGYAEAQAEGKAEPRSWFSGTLTKCHLDQGRVTSAIRWGQETAILLQPLGRKIYYRTALAAYIEARAFAGEADEAAQVLAEVEAASVPMMNWEEGELGRGRAWIAVARGEMDEAFRLLEEAAEVAARSGDRVIESAALHDRARLGRAGEVAGRLAELAELVEGPLAPARAAHAAALVARDPAALEAASGAFEDLGALLLAAEAAADAAVAWRQAGNPRKAAAAEGRAHVLAARCEGARTPALTAVTARATLTARELEIARLAAAGVPNKEIAARLYLSLHTVQNKLHTAYEKLGIEGRAELAEALKSS